MKTEKKKQMNGREVWTTHRSVEDDQPLRLGHVRLCGPHPGTEMQEHVSRWLSGSRVEAFPGGKVAQEGPGQRGEDVRHSR